MTQEQWSALEKYIRDRADEIGLRDWYLILEHDPPEDENHIATVKTEYGRKYAYIRVRGDFRDCEPENQRATIIHELIHLHLRPMHEIIRCDLADANVLRQSEYDLIHSAFVRAEEYAVDGLAYDVAKKYPLIDWKVDSKPLT